MKISSLFDDPDLRSRIHRAEIDAIERLGRLTPTQSRVLHHMVTGIPNKLIAHELGLSMRTVENHRLQIMERVGTKNMLALARLVVVAGL
jgi:two-component system response regulator FixJ